MENVYNILGNESKMQSSRYSMILFSERKKKKSLEGCAATCITFGGGIRRGMIAWRISPLDSYFFLNF